MRKTPKDKQIEKIDIEGNFDLTVDIKDTLPIECEACESMRKGGYTEEEIESDHNSRLL